ncbi:MAG TPA: SAM-dependent chlorinase/fluorinase [Burkholderiales bacterium]|nr:SAM-dependent chlorinase/fluorinase [Burkholderiales bacterium]
MIFLFTDFGAGLYVGQVKAVLHSVAPKEAVIDLLHDAPAFNVKASAHLLAALAARLPTGSVTLSVVDPGVGGPRRPLVVRADGRWFVGPDNGLISVAAARAKQREAFSIGWRPAHLSTSFHGRDLFAPVAAKLALGDGKAAKLRKAALAVRFGAEDLPEVIYVDHFGNMITGLCARATPKSRRLRVNGRGISYARVFSEVNEGEVFWYENSLGLVEIAAHAGSAAAALGGRVGLPIRVEPA